MRPRETDIIGLGEGLLLLNFTTYSRHSSSNFSKMSLLSLQDQQDFKGTFNQMFDTIEPRTDDTELLKTIKLYLMRHDNVVIKGIDNVVVNNSQDIRSWFESSFKFLVGKTRHEYELYYYRTKNHYGTEVSAGYIKFLDNGMARPTLRCKPSSSDCQQEHEVYYGKASIRHNSNGKRLLYVRFVQASHNSSQNATFTVPQKSKGLYAIFFWPANGVGFDFTRGMLLGDQDIDTTYSPTTINSCNAVLCTPNKTWKDFFASKFRYPEIQAQHYIHPEKIDFVHKHFLSNIFKTELQKKPAGISTADLENIENLMNTVEIIFDADNLCSYEGNLI